MIRYKVYISNSSKFCLGIALVNVTMEIKLVVIKVILFNITFLKMMNTRNTWVVYCYWCSLFCVCNIDTNIYRVQG